jgi:hypothetical protein
MKIGCWLFFVGVGVFASAAGAQSATQSFTYTVSAINVVSVAGTPSLVINSAVTGSQLTSPTDGTSIWSVTSNATSGSPKSLKASLNSAMPPGVTLEASLAAPTNGVSAGFQALSTTAVALVTGINLSTSANLTVTYRLSALLTAGAVALSSKTITFTLVTPP